MALIKSYKGRSPKWGKDCYFSENATLVGDVTLGDECSVWFNAVVRGDVAPITIGDRTNIQDGSCVHVTHDTGPTHIGSDVTIGHNVTVHACTIHDRALVGMGPRCWTAARWAKAPSWPPARWCCKAPRYHPSRYGAACPPDT